MTRMKAPRLLPVSRRTGLLTVMGGTLALPAFAQAWPRRPVRIIVPYAAGGGTDAFARILAESLSGELGQPCLVENCTGANGVIGSEAVARAEPDRHTLLVAATTHVLNRYVMPSIPFYPLRDFTPVMRLCRTVNILVGAMQAPFDSLPAMIAHARARPGTVSIGHSEASTAYAARLIQRLSDVEFVHVPYRGGGVMMTDVVVGTVMAAMTSTGSSAAHIRAGRMRAGRMRGLGVTTAQRSVVLPNVPTIAEGGIAGYDYGGWYGLFGPAGLPAAITERLAATIESLMARQPLRSRLESLSGNLDSLGPAAFADSLGQEDRRWASAAVEGVLRAE